MNRICLGILASLGVTVSVSAATKVDRAEALPSPKVLERAFGKRDVEAFRQPPKVFAPETWFHFIGGNVAPQGITADLEAIAGAGIEGVQFFHGQFGGPWPGVEPQIKCLSEKWDAAVGHVAKECERLGLRFTMQNCPGWAMSGGPWIAPSNAMRHLVWSRTEVAGGTVAVSLAKPQPSTEEWRDYRDVAVIAFPTPEGDTDRSLVPVSVKSNREALPWEKCLKNEKGGKIVLEPGNEPTWVEVVFKEAVTLRTLQFPSVQAFNHGWCYVPGVTVTVQAVLPEGPREVARHVIPPSTWQENKAISLACSDALSTTYRITIDNKRSMAFTSLQLFTVARKNNWESEAAFVLRGLMREPHPRQSPAAWVDPARIVDVTDKMDALGTLQWYAPKGRWTVLRWGHVNTGKKNGPAPAEATGWECDKLSPKGAETHFAGYIGRLSAKKGPVGGGLLQGLLLDSWECESQTWTPGLDNTFMKRRGYPLFPWLPALAGYVVGDPEITTRFLRDWRSAINDLLVENFFGRMAELGHKNGLTISFETASGDVFPGDILEYYKHADVPMCEFWQPRSEGFVGSLDFKPIKPCASAARLYGKPRVAAEAFTSFALTWNEHLDMLKDVANIHFAEGVTHLVFHTYTHNPRTDGLPPGTAFGSGIGTPFLRGQTWWRHMPEFSGYLARCGYLLERGRPVSDVLWYLGDEQDHKPPQEFPFPKGFKYDYCNPDILLSRLSVRDGLLMTPEGLRYRVLWLRDCRRMLPETLEKIVSLVRKGATVVGERPQGLATLCGGNEAEARFNEAVDALWGAAETSGEGRVGKGRVLSGLSLDAAFVRLGLEPDVTGEGLLWCHRQTKDAEWYFVAAPAQRGFRGSFGFRSLGKVEVWDPVSGVVADAGVVAREGSRSLVALDLPPAGSCFVVFRKDAKSGKTVERVERDGVPLIDARAPVAAAVSVPQVVSARYGDQTKEGRWKDVSELVRAALQRGDASVRPDNAWAGGDPALGTPKRLSVTLRQADGRETIREAKEGEPLPLLEPAVAVPKVCEVVEGGKALVAWESGRYRVTRADGASKEVEARLPRRVPLSDGWLLAFPKGWGAPETVRVEALKSWTELDLPAEAKAFSGTVRYDSRFTLEPLSAGGRVELDLGRVEMIAKVCVNDVSVGTVWASPFRLDVTRAVKPGLNHLTVEVTSTWFNRLVFDAGLPEAERKTWTIKGPDKGAALCPSGLLGPVTLCVGQYMEE